MLIFGGVSWILCSMLLGRESLDSLIQISGETKLMERHPSPLEREVIKHLGASWDNVKFHNFDKLLRLKIYLSLLIYFTPSPGASVFWEFLENCRGTLIVHIDCRPIQKHIFLLWSFLAKYTGSTNLFSDDKCSLITRSKGYLHALTSMILRLVNWSVSYVVSCNFLYIPSIWLIVCLPLCLKHLLTIHPSIPPVTLMSYLDSTGTSASSFRPVKRWMIFFWGLISKDTGRVGRAGLVDGGFLEMHVRWDLWIFMVQTSQWSKDTTVTRNVDWIWNKWWLQIIMIQYSSTTSLIGLQAVFFWSMKEMYNTSVCMI